MERDGMSKGDWKNEIDWYAVLVIGTCAYWFALGYICGALQP